MTGDIGHFDGLVLDWTEYGIPLARLAGRFPSASVSSTASLSALDVPSCGRDRRSRRERALRRSCRLGDSYPRMFFAALLACRTRPAVLKKHDTRRQVREHRSTDIFRRPCKLSIHLLLSREFVLLLFQLLNDGVICVQGQLVRANPVHCPDLRMRLLSDCAASGERSQSPSQKPKTATMNTRPARRKIGFIKTFTAAPSTMSGMDSRRRVRRTPFPQETRRNGIS